MVGVGGSSPLGRTKSTNLFSYFYYLLVILSLLAASKYTVSCLQAVSAMSYNPSLLRSASFFQFIVIINSHNHFSIHFTEISLYNTAQFIVEWFQLININLPNTEKLQTNRMYKLA